eukprot:scaffold7362_cov266-Pinguiococcus_pyrenoidosus.AAC.13
MRCAQTGESGSGCATRRGAYQALHVGPDDPRSPARRAGKLGRGPSSHQLVFPPEASASWGSVCVACRLSSPSRAGRWQGVAPMQLPPGRAEEDASEDSENDPRAVTP